MIWYQTLVGPLNGYVPPTPTDKQMESLTNNRMKGIEYMRAVGDQTKQTILKHCRNWSHAVELAQATGYSQKTVTRNLNNYCAEGLVEVKTDTPKGGKHPCRYWRLTNKGKNACT